MVVNFVLTPVSTHCNAHHTAVVVSPLILSVAINATAMKNKRIKTIFFLLLLAACTPMKITHRWVAGELEAQNHQRILVVSLVNQPVGGWDEKIETHITNDLKSLGIPAVSALKRYGSGYFTQGEDRLMRMVRDSGYSGVVTVALLGKDSEQIYVPPVAANPPEDGQGAFRNYTRQIQSRVSSPGYYALRTRYFWETRFYGFPAGNLVYKVESKAFDPASIENMAHRYGEMIVKDMLQHRAVKKQPLPEERE